jgi:hypothetical protein
MTRAAAAALGAALLAVVCTPCQATELELPDPYEDEEDITEQEGEGPAIDHFNQGVEYFKDARYDAALAEFLESYAIKSNWAVLYNIGVCYHRLGRYDDAVRELQGYLERGGAWIPPKRKTFVNELIEQMLSTSGSIIIDHLEPGVRVWIDGNPVGDTPLADPVTVAVGLHSVSAYSEGHYPFEKEVPVTGGGETRVTLELEPTPVLSTWYELHGSSSQLSHLGRIRIAALTFWGLGGAALAGAIVTSTIQLARGSDSDALELATTIQLITAGGAALTGLALWIGFKAGLRRRLAYSLPWLSVAPAGPDGGAVFMVGMRTWPWSV